MVFAVPCFVSPVSFCLCFLLVSVFFFFVCSILCVQVGYKSVDDYVTSGMVVGLGTGSTAAFAGKYTFMN